MQVATVLLALALIAPAPPPIAPLAPTPPPIPAKFASPLEARSRAYEDVLTWVLDVKWEAAFRRTEGQVHQPKDQLDRFEALRQMLWALRGLKSFDDVKTLDLEKARTTAYALHRLLLVFHAVETAGWRKLADPMFAAYARARALAPESRALLAAEAAAHYKLGDTAKGDLFTPPPAEELAADELPMMLTWAAAKGDRKELVSWLRSVNAKHAELVRWWGYESDSVNAFRSDPEVAGLLGSQPTGWAPGWTPLEIWRDQLLKPEGAWAVVLTRCYAPAEERERLFHAADALSRAMQKGLDTLGPDDALPVAEGALVLAEHLKKRGVTSWEKVAELAVKAADRGLAKDPGGASLAAVRGVALFLLGHTAEAARALASPPPAESVTGENAFRLARYFALQKNLEKLVVYFEAAVRHDPERARQWFETADELADFRQEPELLAAVARASQGK